MARCIASASASGVISSCSPTTTSAAQEMRGEAGRRVGPRHQRADRRVDRRGRRRFDHRARVGVRAGRVLARAAALSSLGSI